MGGNSVLLLLQNDLCELGTSLENFGLPTPNTDDTIYDYPHVIKDEVFEVSEQQAKSQRNIATFNMQQALAHQMILQSVLGSEHPQRLFFINAPGGYGKTFLMETLLSTVCLMGKIALAVASSGIAAELLEGGRTAYSCFKIPITICDESMCSILLQSTHAQLIKSTSLIWWDDVLMSNKQHIECIDRSLRDIWKVDKPFGGITFVFGGDPCQILHVVHHGECPQIVKAFVKSSHLWNHASHLVDGKHESWSWQGGVFKISP